MLRRAEGICVTKLVEISCRIRKDRKKEVVEKKSDKSCVHLLEWIGL
jgi:hypothetical protein